MISFDDFLWKLYVYAENDDKWFENRTFGHGDEIVPVGVHLLKKCSCGGKPEIYFDHVDDFFIRCSSAELLHIQICGLKRVWMLGTKGIHLLSLLQQMNILMKLYQLKKSRE